MRIVLIIILAFLSASCSREVARYLPNRPDKAFDEDLKDAPADFKQGWSDGCEAGMSAGSNTFYKIFYRQNKADGYKMVASPDYKAAWGNAFWYCYRYDHVKQKSSIWGSTFRGLI